MLPVRTCVGCRRRDSTDRMLRLTLHEGTIRVASHRKGPGRGASVHRDPACAEAAQRPGALARAFKQPVRWGTEARETFSQLMVEERVDGAGLRPAESVAGESGNPSRVPGLNRKQGQT